MTPNNNQESVGYDRVRQHDADDEEHEDEDEDGEGCCADTSANGQQQQQPQHEPEPRSRCPVLLPVVLFQSWVRLYHSLDVNIQYSILSNTFFFWGATVQFLMSIWDYIDAQHEQQWEIEHRVPTAPPTTYHPTITSQPTATYYPTYHPTSLEEAEADAEIPVRTVSFFVYYIFFSVGPLLYILNSCVDLKWLLADDEEDDDEEEETDEDLTIAVAEAIIVTLPSNREPSSMHHHENENNNNNNNNTDTVHKKKIRTPSRRVRENNTDIVDVFHDEDEETEEEDVIGEVPAIPPAADNAEEEEEDLYGEEEEDSYAEDYTEYLYYYLELVATSLFFVGATLEFYGTVLVGVQATMKSTKYTPTTTNSTNTTNTTVMLGFNNNNTISSNDTIVSLQQQRTSTTDDDDEAEEGVIVREETTLPWYLSSSTINFISLHVYLLSFVLSLIQVTTSPYSSNQFKHLQQATTTPTGDGAGTSSITVPSPRSGHRHGNISSGSNNKRRTNLSMLLIIKGVTIIGYCLLVVGTLLGVIIAYLYNPKISPYLNAHLKALLPIRKLKELNLDLLYLISAALWNIDAILCMTADVLLIFYSNTIPTTAIATVDTVAVANHNARVEADRDSPDTNNSNNEAVSFI